MAKHAGTCGRGLGWWQNCKGKANSGMAKLHDKPSRGVLMKGKGFPWKNMYFVPINFDEGRSSQKTRENLKYEGGRLNLVLRGECTFWI